MRKAKRVQKDTAPQAKKLSQEEITQRIRDKIPIKQSELPPPPERHEDLADHIMGDLFLQAEFEHLQSHKEMDSWTVI
ncbi:hypothetical protein N657DRAFT_626345, partial [Parathielavia appendiculata]